MDPTLKDVLARIERAQADNAIMQQGHADQLRMIAERLEEVVKLLTPEERDGPGLDELLGQIIGQLTELTGYARTTIRMQTSMEQNLPGDVVHALGALPNGPANGKGAGTSSRA